MNTATGIKIIFSVGPLEGTPRHAKRIDYGVEYALQTDRAYDHETKKPLTGAFRVIASRDEFWGGHNSRDYRGKVLVDPTWRQLKSEARKAALATRDFHHVFLEAAHRTGRIENGVEDLTLSMGS